MTQCTFWKCVKRPLLAFLCGLTAFGQGSWALADRLQDSLQIHGFAAQAAMSTTDNNVFGETDDQISLGFTELGINASVLATPRAQLSAQIVSRRAGEGHGGSPELDYALLDYSFLSRETGRMGVRAGRIKNPLGLYNETRDVPFTRPTLLLPQSIYLDITRNLGLSGDGAGFYGEHRFEDAALSFEFNLGYPRVDVDEEYAILGADRPGEMTRELSGIGRLMYEREGGRLRLAFSAAHLNTDYKPVGPPTPENPITGELPAGSFQFNPLILSAQYNAEFWSVTSEWALRRFEREQFGPAFDVDMVGESYYLQGTYRFAPDWEAVLRYDVLYLDRDDRDGREFAAICPVPRHTRFAKDLTVGLRWNITPSWMLRGEYHYVDGTGWLSLRDNPDPNRTERYWSLFALQIAFRF